MAVQREMLWVVCGQLLTFVGGILNVKLLTNLMSVGEYGALALGLSIAGIIHLFVFGPLGQGVLRYLSVARERGMLADYFLGIKYLHFRAAWGLLGLAFIGGALAMMFVRSQWVMLSGLSVVYGVSAGVHYSMLALQSAARNRKAVAMHQAGFVWIGLAMAIICMRLFGWRSDIALLGMICGAVLVNASHWRFVRADGLMGHHWSHVGYLKRGEGLAKDIFAYSRSFVYFSAFAAVSMYADRWVLQGLYGPGVVGIYAALYLIANAPVTLVMGMVNQLMVPIIFQVAGSASGVEQHQRSNRLLARVFLGAVILCLPIVFGAWWLGADIVRLLSNQAYAGQATVLWMVALGLCLFNLGQLLVIKGLSAGRPKLYILPKAVQAISFVLCAYFLAMTSGIAGVAVALIISSVVYLLLVAYVNRGLETGAA